MTPLLLAQILVVDWLFIAAEPPSEETPLADSGAAKKTVGVSKKGKLARMGAGAQAQCLALFGGAACQAVGTLVWPGYGTAAGALCGDFVPLLVA